MYLGHLEADDNTKRFVRYKNRHVEEPKPPQPTVTHAAAIKPDHLSAIDERALVWQWQRRKDHRARDRLLRAFRSPIEEFARRYRGRGLEIEDAISLANIGFLVGLDKFDIRRKWRLWTYASHWVRAEISSATAKSSIVRSPRMVGEKLREQKRKARDPSLNTPEPRDDLLFYECPTYEPRYFDDDALNDALRLLTPRQRQIFIARKLDDDPRALSELAADFGISGEWARQEEKAALRLVSERMSSGGASEKFARQLTSEMFRGRGHKLTHSVFAWPARDFPVARFGCPKPRSGGR